MTVLASKTASFSRAALRLLAEERATAAYVVALSITACVVSVAGPLLVGAIVDSTLRARDARVASTIAVAAALLPFHRIWLLFVRDLMLARIRRSVVRRELPKAFTRLLSMPFASFQNARLTRLTRSSISTNAFTDLVLCALLPACLESITGLLATVLLMRVFPVLAVALLAFWLVALVVIGGLGRESATLFEVELTQTEARRGILREALDGHLTVKAAAAEEVFFARWHRALRRESGTRMRRLGRAVLVDALSDGATYLSAALALGVTGYAVFTQRTSPGGMIAATQLAATVGVAALTLAQSTTSLWQAQTHLPESEPARPSRPVVRVRTHRSAPHVVFDRVSFRYAEGARAILDGISLVAPGGRVTRLASRSGSGKTTLLRLAASLLEPVGGTVTIGGEPAANQRDLVMYVPQDIRVVDGTLLSNLRLFSGGTDASIRRAAAATGLDAIVSRLPLRWATPLSDGGRNISGGQRQLVLLTAALASERPVLLLDETMSHLDAGQRAELLEGPAFHGRTVILVDHGATPSALRDQVTTSDGSATHDGVTTAPLLSSPSEVRET